MNEVGCSFLLVRTYDALLPPFQAKPFSCSLFLLVIGAKKLRRDSGDYALVPAPLLLENCWISFQVLEDLHGICAYWNAKALSAFHGGRGGHQVSTFT